MYIYMYESLEILKILLPLQVATRIGDSAGFSEFLPAGRYCVTTTLLLVTTTLLRLYYDSTTTLILTFQNFY